MPTETNTIFYINTICEFSRWLAGNCDKLRILTGPESIDAIIDKWSSLTPTYKNQLLLNFELPYKKTHSSYYPESEE